MHSYIFINACRTTSYIEVAVWRIAAMNQIEMQKCFQAHNLNPVRCVSILVQIEMYGPGNVKRRRGGRGGRFQLLSLSLSGGGGSVIAWYIVVASLGKGAALKWPPNDSHRERECTVASHTPHLPLLLNSFPPRRWFGLLVGV